MASPGTKSFTACMLAFRASRPISPWPLTPTLLCLTLHCALNFHLSCRWSWPPMSSTNPNFHLMFKALWGVNLYHVPRLGTDGLWIGWVPTRVSKISGLGSQFHFTLVITCFHLFSMFSLSFYHQHLEWGRYKMSRTENPIGHGSEVRAAWL